MPKPQKRSKSKDAQHGNGAADASTAAVLSLASNLRAYRGSRAWSLDELARRSRVSRGMLLQVEGARTNASVATVARIAEALGVSVADLIEPQEQLGRVVRAADMAPMPRGKKGSESRLLLSDGRSPFAELWEFRLEPHDEVHSDGHTPGTRELIQVIQGGRLVVEVGGLVLVAEPGDGVALQADHAHTYRNDSDVLLLFSIAVIHGATPRR